MGACATAASQSVASPSDGATVTSSDPAGTSQVSDSSNAKFDPPPPITSLATAVKRVAPNGSATVSILAQGEEAFLAKLEMQAGAAVPEHRDATEEYIHILEGSGVVTIEGTPHPVNAGSTIFMPPDARVSFQNGDAPMVALQVFAGPGPAAKYDGWSAVGN